MSSAIDRLRQIAAAWHRAVHVDSSMVSVHICDLDAALADLMAQRARAEAAEAECARLQAHIDEATAKAERVLAQMRDAVDAYNRVCEDRDYWRAQATAAAPCVDAVRALGTRLIPGGTGCVVEPERVVAAVERLRAIVESVRSARTASAAAAARYTAAWDAVGTMPPTPAQSEEIAASLRVAYEAGDVLTAALDALDAAGEGR